MSFLTVTIILQNKNPAFSFPPYTIPLYSQFVFENLLETDFFFKCAFTWKPNSLFENQNMSSLSLPPLSANETQRCLPQNPNAIFMKPSPGLHETLTLPFTHCRLPNAHSNALHCPSLPPLRKVFSGSFAFTPSSTFVPSVLCAFGSVKELH